MRITIAIIALALIIPALMLTTGCGRATPVLTLKNASDLGNGLISITYYIKDIDESNADLLVAYSTDGTNWRDATAGTGGDGILGLATSQKGTFHTFVWDYSADIGPGLKEFTRLWLLPIDTDGNDRGKGARTGPLSFGAPLMYVANFGDGTVSVVNTENFGTNASVITSIRVGSGPYRLVYIASKKKVYVTNRTGGTVSVIDTNTNTLRTTITVGNDPTALAVSPTNDMVFVTNRGDDTMTAIDTKLDIVAATVSVGNSPSGIAIGKLNPVNNAHEIYVSNFNDNSVTTIVVDSDGTLYPTPTPLAVGAWPQGIAVSPNGMYLWVACSEAGEVWVFETANLGTVSPTKIPVDNEPRDIVISGNGNFVYVNNFGSGSVVKIDADTLQTVGFYNVNAAPDSLTLSSDGERIYVSNYNDNKITGFDPDTGTTVGTVGVGANPTGLVILPGAPKD